MPRQSDPSSTPPAPHDDTRGDTDDTTAALRAWRRLTRHMSVPVFFGAAASAIVFVLWGTLFTRAASSTFNAAQEAVARHFGWYYAVVTTALLGFCLWLVIGPVGRLRLGPDGAEPQYSRFAWFTMLFSAGMGTGLMFWSVAEPVRHLLEPPPHQQALPLVALRYTFFHWGLHPWAIYAVLGVAIAYFHFRQRLPLAPRSAFHPLIGRHIHGLIGHVVDVVATVGTLLGVATSLGFGAMQINAGLQHGWAVPEGQMVQSLIITVITAVATISVVLGVSRGIRRLSQLNFVLAFLLAAFVLIAGPTLTLFRGYVTTLGSYVGHLWQMSWSPLDTTDLAWQQKWTLFYWGWWISWSPFVAIFTARISRGRTIREYVITLLLLPSGVTMAWVTIFGGSALERVAAEDLGGRLRQVAQHDMALSLHVLLEGLPWSSLTTVLATLLVTIFFITSSDSGSLVNDMVTSGGRPQPPRAQRVFWAVAEGAVAVTLLLAGGLQALQAAAITSGLAMSLVLIAASIGLWRALRRDVHQHDTQQPPEDDQ